MLGHHLIYFTLSVICLCALAQAYSIDRSGNANKDVQAVITDIAERAGGIGTTEEGKRSIDEEVAKRAAIEATTQQKRSIYENIVEGAGGIGTTEEKRSIDEEVAKRAAIEATTQQF